MQLGYNKQAGLWQVYDLPGAGGAGGVPQGQGPFLVDLPLTQVRDPCLWLHLCPAWFLLP
jgi:hypothetical protein